MVKKSDTEKSSSEKKQPAKKARSTPEKATQEEVKNADVEVAAAASNADSIKVPVGVLLSEPVENKKEAAAINHHHKAEPQPNELKVVVSAALVQKLKAQAVEEGISLQDYLRELLSESVTLRAWEIVERRIQMRGGGQPQSQHQNNRHNNQGGHNRNNNHHNNNNRNGGENRGPRRGNMSQNRYQNIMEDKATFLEYVRNQDRDRR